MLDVTEARPGRPVKLLPLSILEPFEGCSEALLETVAARASALSSPPGRSLARPLPGDALAVVRAGAVAVTDVTPGGRRLASMVLQPGDLLSTLGPVRRPSLTAITAVSLVLMRRALLDHVSARHPPFWMAVLGALSRQAAEIGRIAADVSLMSVRERLFARLRELAGRFGVVRREGIVLSLPLTHRQWAELVGASREAVTMAFQGLERDGRVERRGPQLWLLPGPARKNGLSMAEAAELEPGRRPPG
jgi:CRP-like cAMP-binding protein